MSRWPAFSTHFGMSIRLPESVLYTTSWVPAASSRIARISSINGPGQKLPRASTIRTLVAIVAVPVIVALPSDEQRRGAIREELDHRGGSDRLADTVDHVLALEAEHVHR